MLCAVIGRLRPGGGACQAGEAEPPLTLGKVVLTRDVELTRVLPAARSRLRLTFNVHLALCLLYTTNPCFLL